MHKTLLYDEKFILILNNFLENQIDEILTTLGKINEIHKLGAVLVICPNSKMKIKSMALKLFKYSNFFYVRWVQYNRIEFLIIVTSVSLTLNPTDL